ncbi:SDR family oxidoreductase [Candidatus Pantoea floridensis]|uniref:Nucleoside-diphosphate-sugar epimerase n=1 Tax=Candidatus Pantoea floridensis TaxID=1938870 RepID=A0A286BXL3_9GAMM|nr:SDR family oxidoreductase [Pantoea floridensis]PIF21372.1 nucleoside-diphosphate-sugar epimerase [Enterobacteriaceae bacterium JKS000233]SOD38884.1 Nucleoside-diphosphate-sugar epimerase [Pantoea floridensis]
MKKVAIVGLGWLGMPLAMALTTRGWQVTGSKTSPDGVDAARRCGIEAFQLVLTPELECEAEELDTLMAVDALVVTLPASRTVKGAEDYMQAVQNVVDTALAKKVPRIIFTSSSSVYGSGEGVMKENSPLQPETVAGKTLVELENWLHDLPGTSVDIVRLAGLVGPNRHPGRFLAGKTGLENGGHAVNLVHLDDVVDAIVLLLQTPKGGHVYNLCASKHPSRDSFYPSVSKQLGLEPPTFVAEAERSAGKVVDGSKIANELGFEYTYDDPMKMPLE